MMALPSLAGHSDTAPEAGQQNMVRTTTGTTTSQTIIMQRQNNTPNPRSIQEKQKFQEQGKGQPWVQCIQGRNMSREEVILSRRHLLKSPGSILTQSAFLCSV